MVPLELSLDDILWALGPVIYETPIMVGISSLTTVVLELPLDMMLFATQRDGIVANPVLPTTLSTIANTTRSIPYVAPMLSLIPLTRWLIGSSVGPMVACVSLTIGAVPFFARLVESTLCDIHPGKMDATHAMGSTRMQTVTKVLLPEADSSLIAAIATMAAVLVGYSAVAGLTDGGGPRHLVYNYSCQRFETSVQLVTIAILMGMAQPIQILGDVVIRRVNHR